MKNLKKLISVVICIAMMASFLAVSTSAASYPDVTEDKSYYAAVELLSALDILKGDENGNFNPDAEIKRSEFAAVVCRALGQENAATGTTSKFSDVASNHWAVGYIGWAAGKSIVNGYEDGTFAPDKAVTFQEAVKMVMCALGYEKLALNNGGYPYGFLALAGTYGVTAGLSADPEAPASRGLVAQLVANALEAPIMDTSYYSSTEERYVVYDGSKAADYEERTILNWYLDIIKVKANVANNYKTDPDLWKKNRDPKVELELLKVFNESDKTDYEDDLYDNNGNLEDSFDVYVGATDASSYLAYDVIAYMFLNDNDDFELKAIIPDGKSVETLEVTKDIVKSDVQGSKVEFEYWEDIDNDSRETEVDVASDAMVYVNGSEVGKLSTEAGEAAFEELAGSSSTVTFIGSKGDDFTKIFIVNYEYGQIEEIDLEDEYITLDVTSLELSKDARGDKFVYTIYKDGEVIELKDLQVGDVLSIVAPAGDLDNEDYLDIYVSSETLTGTVTSAKSDNVTYYIDKVEYKAYEKGLLDVGDAGTFYLTHDGKVYSAEATTTLSDNYGFILKVGSTKSFGENTWQVRLFTKDGSIKTYTIGSTLKVTKWDADKAKNVETTYKRANGGQDTYMEGLDKLTLQADTEAEVYANTEARLITFTEDGSTITKITEASDSVNKADLKKAYDVSELSGAYKPATGRFAGYTYTDDTKLFYAPISAVYDDEDKVTGYVIDEDDVALLSVSGLDEEKDSYEGYAYATNDDKELGAAVITSDLGFAGKASALAVVISSAEGLNAEGEKATTITVLQAGTVATYAVDEDADNADDLEAAVAGDIIQFVVNGVGDITNAEVIFHSNGTGLGKLSTFANDANAIDDAKIQYVYGIVGNVSSKVIDLGENFNDFDDDASNDDEAITVGYSTDYEDGCTLAKVDVAKLTTSPNSAVAKVSAFSGFKATKKTLSDKYVMVARLVDGDIVDAVSYTLNNVSADDFAKADYDLLVD